MFVEQVDRADARPTTATTTTHTASAQSQTNAPHADSDSDSDASASSLLSRIAAPFTACFGAALAPAAPLLHRASGLAEPYYGADRTRTASSAWR